MQQVFDSLFISLMRDETPVIQLMELDEKKLEELLSYTQDVYNRLSPDSSYRRMVYDVVDYIESYIYRTEKNKIFYV